ncbi:DUF4350 domain-containing protein [Streptomyces sp. XM4193]|uniref:DUF4350 domain-containing protein n=1 Tax=Streptomyces sp. XM4193 TaxID=2929782 RepID=UPI001FFC14AD|nr:DUF4350 domain-containing protein [Streptomyces sp. XM4193]MCK1799168.1 DUF4350 domain-containing protein [Streptomyces sp. XM4193]
MTRARSLRSAPPAVPKAPGTPPPAADDSASSSGRGLRPPRARGLVLSLVFLLLAGLAIAALGTRPHHDVLDPRSPAPNGSRAVARLLATHGVDVRVVTTTEDAAHAASRPDTTLLVSRPELLGPAQLSTLGTAFATARGRTVLLAPDDTATQALVPRVRATSRTQISARPADCEAGYAVRAGPAELGGLGYTTSAAQADSCYPTEHGSALVRIPRADNDGDTVLLGTGELLFNERLASEGNASLATQLLGSRTHLVWYLPSPTDPAADNGDERGLFSLLPDGWLWGSAQLAVAVVLVALWRARRLGAVVVERVPVAVPASETTEGRARLYRRSGARDRAAEALRSAARERLAPLVGVAPANAHIETALCPAVDLHTADSPPEPADPPTAAALLFGPAPTNDTELVLLAEQLDRLHARIKSSRAERDRRP